MTANEAARPLNATDVEPVKFVPVIVTVDVGGPLVGVKLVIVGADAATVTVKIDALVPVPPGVVTAIGPDVAPLGTVTVICVSEFTLKTAPVPLNVTEEAPVKFVPVMVTLLPTGPLVGLKLVTVGADGNVPLQPGSWNDAMRVSQLSCS